MYFISDLLYNDNNKKRRKSRQKKKCSHIDNSLNLQQLKMCVCIVLCCECLEKSAQETNNAYAIAVDGETDTAACITMLSATRLLRRIV